jgi:glycosyltransferase 2 family protein
VKSLLSINPAVIAVMVGLQLLGFGFYTSAWHQLIIAAGYRMKFRTCLGITLASIFAVYVMPSGVFLEVLRCVLGSKETGMPFGESTSTVVLHRILYIVGFLASTALALFAILSGNVANSMSVLALASIPIATVVGLGILLYVSLSPRKISPALERVLKLAQPVIRLVQKEAVVEGKADRFLSDYNVGFRQMLKSRRRVLVSFISSLGDWSCSVTILWIVLVALGANASVWVAVITVSIGKMIQMTPIAIPGMIGVYETAITTVLVLFAVPVSLAASAAILSRIVTVWLELPVTGVAAYHYGFKLLGKGSIHL